MITLPILEKKTKPYTNITVIHVNYIWKFFGNFHMTRSRGIMFEVKTNKFILG